LIAIGSDHAGYNLKTEIIEYLKNKGYEVRDFGTDSASCSVDYPDYAVSVAQAIKNGECEKGILVCGTGIGISIAANKIPGIRAALCTDTFMARMSIEHNNANILALGSRVIGIGTALEIVDTWLQASFAGGKHARRVGKISSIEEENKRG
jgi:ribose 5-phosphate isomerase B